MKAFYLWNVNPKEKNKIPNQNIFLNSRYFETNIIDSEKKYFDLIKKDSRLFSLWSKIPFWIMKSDIIRLLLIYEYGGFYFDVDCTVQENFLTTLSQNKPTVIFTESILKSTEELSELENKNEERKLRIANYAFGSLIVKNPFYYEVIEEILKRIDKILLKKKISIQEVLFTTGPDVITSIYHSSTDKSMIDLLPQGILKHECYNSWYPTTSLYKKIKDLLWT